MWLLVLLLLIPALSSAQAIEECPGCVLGIYDDHEMSRNYGFWDPTSDSLKSVWIGIMYDPALINQLSGLTGVELSISGFVDPFRHPAFAGVPEPAVVIGNTISTPTDSIGVGGVSMAWNACLPNNRAVIRIDLVSLQTASDIVLRVQPKFGPSSPELPFPLFTQCQGPFPAVRVTAGCYVINPTVGPGETVDGCTLTETVAVESSTWSAIKVLFRDD